MSLNTYCAERLADAQVIPTEGDLREPARRIVRRAVLLLGDGLAGVVVIGSWVRGHAREGSDLDVLIVVEPEVEISRELYRRWDAEPLTWEGRSVDAHFVRLPASGRRIPGIWAEASVDGVLLFDRDLSLSLALGELRRRIVAGETTRRTAHGQPYWVHEGPPDPVEP